ncbi:MAG: tetrathionate reductase family octaheme c-type cytochrome, partial [Gammaproteobacteria bacterium]|nr:tetrathionate reductase family octaheme c-type cytochrome [Gammaproteobacteria bacterium]NNL45627.1 tetrathionate reductase family octaheme c-type cytochrome [Woeseiaceae bacterium]
GIGDLPDEDINGDDVVDVLDCNATSSSAYAAEQLHKGYFEEHAYEGTRSCLNCHGKIGDELITTAHFKWEGFASNIEGHAGHIHGKRDILNNFCIAIPSNEGRCTQCHAGYGYAEAGFDFSDPDNVDCLVCHDQTGEYSKAPKTAGLPADGVDLTLVAQSVAMNSGVPTIDNCISCHAEAGGGDNVKHGDLSLSLANTTRDFDVHMGTDGADYECVECHKVERDGDEMVSHGIGGMPYHSVEEGDMQQCEDCHSSRLTQHINTTVAGIINFEGHDRLACQVCHIPTFARNQSTKTEWYWAEAGQDIAEEDIPLIAGRKAYDKKKGRFVWENDVRPELRYFNGKYKKFLIGEGSDVFTSEPVVLAEPVGDYTDPAAMIYPFKKMIGNQPADANTNKILVPHLFGGAGGPNAYWGKYDWNLALQDGSNVTGQGYTGEYRWVDTKMYLSVNHEVAPAEMAYGMDGHCDDCHFSDQIDWGALSWSGDPIFGDETRIE